MGREIWYNSIFGLETSKGETGILNMYCGFSPKEEMVDYCKGKSDSEKLGKGPWLESWA